ncbi:hypothetical protein GCM10028808_09990 [Spirosoma migulaei]
MTKTLKLIPRHQLNTTAWDACVADSPQRILYGYSWYLDSVLPAPDWKWVGLVLPDESGDTYQAVMPVPLRRKTIAGITYEWVVHQPFFCQFLGVFSLEKSIDSGPFLALMIGQFRYGSIYNTYQQPDGRHASQLITTHTLDLSVGYETIYYSHDRKTNLHRAHRDFDKATTWTITESTDVEPLLTLFQANHADAIDGGVANWAYAIFRRLMNELSKRNLTILRYAMHKGNMEAGVLFLCAGDRIIYLFNAASELGRKVNARTLLIDQLIQEYAGKPAIFDFESPEKPSIRDFYRSFGAVEQSFWTLRWNRLTVVERGLVKFKSWF